MVIPMKNLMRVALAVTIVTAWAAPAAAERYTPNRMATSSTSRTPTHR